jgi:hypothetical protein
MNTPTKMSCLFLMAALLTACNLQRPEDNTTNGSEDQVYPVEFFAEKGILQGHDRYDTEYRDLASGSASLSSGSFLRTLDGEAFVVLPGDSVLKLGPNTEVQIGMYENGIMIWQHSGSTLHIVVPREGWTYQVATPFGIVEAHGTEYEVRVDYPAEGWVTVYWGEIGIVETVPAVVYGLVPEGVLFISPDGATEYMRLEPGDTLTWDIDPATGQPRGRRDIVPPDDVAQHNRDLAQRIRALMQDYWDGIITRDEYHELLNNVLNDALGMGDSVVVPEDEEAWDLIPPISLGGLYGGSLGSQVVTLCYDGSFVSRITWGTEMMCTDKGTNEMYVRSYIFTFGLDAISAVGTDGYFSLVYPYDPTLSLNTVISVEGNISSGGGSVGLTVRTESDVEVCDGSATLPLNYAGTECSGE